MIQFNPAKLVDRILNPGNKMYNLQATRPNTVIYSLIDDLS